MRACEFERALRVVRDSGIHREIEAAVATTGRGGRRRTIEVDVFFAAIIATVLAGNALTLTNVHKLLTTQLGESVQVSLGVTTQGKDGKARKVGYHVLTRLLARINEALRARAEIDDYSGTEVQERLDAIMQRLSDALLDSTIPAHLRGRGSYALDGTAIDSFAKGSRKVLALVSQDADHAPDDPAPTEADWVDTSELTASWDRDGSWGYRTQTYDNRSTWVFGYHAFALVPADAPTCPDGRERPALVERLTLRPANANAVSASLTLIDSLREAGIDVLEVINDQEFSYKKADSWSRPLRERGIEQVLDMHPNDRGARDYNGILWLDGSPHCPSTPQRLHVIPKPAHMCPKKPKKTDDEEKWTAYRRALDQVDAFKALIIERQQYALVMNAVKDATSGKTQYMCPAQANKLNCANVEVSTYLPDSVTVVENPPVLLGLPAVPPKPAPGASAEERAQYRIDKDDYAKQADYLKICRQPTLVIPGNVQDKVRQRHYWGSPEWFDAYKRRVIVEGVFGMWKNPSSANVKRGWTRVVGIVKTMLMLSCFAVAQNILRLRMWAATTGDESHWLLTPDPEDFGWEERTADVFDDAPNAPPAAA